MLIKRDLERPRRAHGERQRERPHGQREGEGDGVHRRDEGEREAREAWVAAGDTCCACGQWLVARVAHNGEVERAQAREAADRLGEHVELEGRFVCAGEFKLAQAGRGVDEGPEQVP